MDVLREHGGPLTDHEWAQLLADEGFGYVEELTDDVADLDDDSLGILPDGRNIALDVLLDGRMLTHRLTAPEIAVDVVDVTDFEPIMMLTSGNMEDDGFVVVLRDFADDRDDERLLERGVTDADWLDGDALLLPPGFLADHAPGDLIALGVADGHARLRRVDGDIVPAPDLTPRFTQGCAERGVLYLESEVWQLMTDDPTVFTAPTLPLSELVEATGFARSGDLVASHGFDFDAYRRDVLMEMYAAKLGISAESAPAVAMFLTLVETLDRGDDENVEARFFARPALYDALADPEVAEAALHEALGEQRFDPVAVERAAEWLLRFAPRQVTAAAHWLTGRAAEATGRIDEAERHYEQAVSADSAFDAALLDLARYASDRGDAVRGLSLLNRMPAGDEEPLYAVLQRFQPVDRPGLGRNDRCWCGSGRKYKACHLGKADHPLAERAAWLYLKAAMYADETEWRDLLIDLAEIRAEHWEGGEDALISALDDPFVTDVVLFEGGAFAEFVERRGQLLPADELLLAQQWLLCERSVHEVEAVRPGEGLILRDLRTGDRHDVRERAASRQLHVGHLICARIVPAGDTWQIFGGAEPITMPQRAPLMEMLDDETTDPADLVEYLSARFAPQAIVNADGSPLVACAARFEVTDTKSLRRRLSRRYGAAEGDQWAWLDGDQLLGILRLQRDTEPWVLEVDAVNEERFDELLDAVEALDPHAMLLEETRMPAAGLLAQAQQSGPAPEPLDPEDSELVALLDKQIRKYERQWLDDSIPALDGYTPRQAAADPTRRDDLIRLLDSFPQEEWPGAMSVRRLREALGL